jgi:RIO-like serine/threonine protein kinase
MHFCLVPLGWLGRLVTRIEIRSLRRCEGIPEVPRVLARPRPNVYLYEYIEGTSLGAKPILPADFFDRLLAAVRQIHERHVVHFDLHKPGNILVDSEGRPHIIDFQLSLHIGDRALLSRRLSRRLRLWLQSYDIYHVCKHKRRLQPELLRQAEEQLSRNRSLPLRIHRAVAKPYKYVRRACLRYLYAKGILIAPDSPETCPETNPARWARRQ